MRLNIHSKKIDGHLESRLEVDLKRCWRSSLKSMAASERQIMTV